MYMDTTSLSATISASLTRSEYDGQIAILAMTEALIQRAQEEAKSDQGVDFNEHGLRRDQTEKARLLGFKDRTADSTAVLSKARAAIDQAEISLGKVKTLLQGITSASTAEERAAAAASYNEALAEINSQVAGSTQLVNGIPTNLIGNPSIPEFSTSDLYAPVSPSGGSVNVEGTFLGSDFVLEDSSGYLWHREENKGAFVQYVSDGTGEATGLEIALDGLTLSSYDATTGAATFGGSGSLSGTINRVGTNLLDSEFHNEFASDADVAAALSDVDAALITLQTEGSLIEAKAGLVEASIESLSGKISTLEADIQKSIDAQLTEKDAEATAAQLKLRLALNNINLLSAASTGIVENVLISAQGLAPAPGVFGTLGY
jgi:hypothetical protein